MIEEKKIEPVKLEKSGDNLRNSDGTFKQGHEGMGGRPKGISITEEIRKKLAEVPEGQKKTYLEILILKILKKAISDEDEQMIKQIWNYIDGMPKQSISHDIDETIEKIKIEVYGNKTENNKNIPQELSRISNKETSNNSESGRKGKQ